VRSCGRAAAGGYCPGSEASRRIGGHVDKKLDLFEDIFWGVLPVVGVLVATFAIALVMRLSIGKW
jgi:hypothetical protein